MAQALLGLLVVAVVLLPLPSSGAETVKLSYVVSVYADSKGGGLDQPEGVACSENSFFVTDTRNGRLLQYALQDTSVRVVAEIELPGTYPIRVQTNSREDIFALDGKGRRIAHLSPTGQFVDYLEPKGLPSPTAYIPKSFWINGDDEIYILDVFSERVLVLDPEGQYLRHISFPEEYGFLSDLTVDFRGNLLAVDSVNAVIFSAAKDSKSFSLLTGSLREYVNFPTSIATDSRGLIYIVDQNGGTVVILGQNGTFQGQWLGRGWGETLLRYPSQLCINKKGEVFIADRGNNRIQVFRVLE